MIVAAFPHFDFPDFAMSQQQAAKTIQVSLNRHDRTPWGFRLHGGLDVGSPLMIQKVRINFGKSYRTPQ